jgi:hypothetical protein
LHDIYRRDRWRDNFCEHEPTGWAYTLNKFLGCDFAKWAHDNPEAKQPLAPQFGIAGYPVSNLLFFNSLGNLPNALTKILKL